MAYVLTIDQRASRSGDDLVPDLVRTLNRGHTAERLVRRFERTAGDELQGVVSSAQAVVDITCVLIRSEKWSVGLGIGGVDEPLPRSTRAGRGAAFVHARAAVERAKSGPHRVGVVGDDAYRAEQVETVLWLLALLLARRTDGGWEVADLLAQGRTRREVAERLRISASAVSQRVHVAGIVEEQRARALAAQLLTREAER